MTIGAGTLPRRLVIQSKATGPDTFGGAPATWTDVATVWARIEPLIGRELMSAQTISTEISHRITLRYQSMWANPKTVAAYRGVYATRVFNFHASMNSGEMNESISILASEGLNDG